MEIWIKAIQQEVIIRSNHGISIQQWRHTPGRKYTQQYTALLLYLSLAWLLGSGAQMYYSLGWVMNHDYCNWSWKSCEPLFSNADWHFVCNFRTSRMTIGWLEYQPNTPSPRLWFQCKWYPGRTLTSKTPYLVNEYNMTLISLMQFHLLLLVQNTIRQYSTNTT